MRVRDTFAFVLGEWRVERAISDKAEGLSGSFSGTAGVMAVPSRPGRDAPRARYHEEGVMRLGGYEGPARRSLDYVRLADSTLALDFLDGRRFITLDLSEGAWRAVHPCGCDVYEMTFQVESPDALVEQWRVTGPDTDYVARTVLRRVGGGISANAGGALSRPGQSVAPNLADRGLGQRN